MRNPALQEKWTAHQTSISGKGNNSKDKAHLIEILHLGELTVEKGDSVADAEI